MQDSCIGVANDLSLRSNSLKSACLATRKLAKQPIEPMSLGSGQIEWVDSLQYCYINWLSQLGFQLCQSKAVFLCSMKLYIRPREAPG